MSRILWRAGLRHRLQHRLQTLLAVLGIALGVSVVVAVDMANESAARSFARSTEMVTGKATHRIDADGVDIAEELYRAIRVDLGVRESAPVVEGYVAPVDQPRRVLLLLGLEAFAELGFRGSLTGPGQTNLDLRRLLLEPDTVLLTTRLAMELSVRVGDHLPVFAGLGRAQLKVIGLLEPDRQGVGDLDLIVADIATAQSVLARPGALTRIDLALPEDESGAALASEIQRRLPPGVRLTRSETHSLATARLADSFKLNLTAMSLLALIVGMFLIYNTMVFSVVQRRELLGRLRAIGVNRQEIFRLVLGEALLLGTVGALMGLVLGALLGYGLTDLVYRTIDDLYYTVTLREFHPAPVSLVKGLILGCLGSVVAAWFPAREAARIPAGSAMRRSMLEAKVRESLPRMALVGIALLLSGSMILMLPGDALVTGFGALFTMVLGCALLTPGAVVLLSSALGWGLARNLGVMGRMAMRDAIRHLSRTGVAVAALMVALSATVGTGIMVESFRQSVSHWLTSLLNADLYVSPVSAVTGDAAVSLAPGVVEILRDAPGVTGIATYRYRRLLVNDRLVRLVALRPAPRTRAGYRFTKGAPAEAWALFDTGQLLVSEPLSLHLDLSIGDQLTLETATGPREFDIAGIFTDYGSEHGRIMLHADHYLTHWQDQTVSSAAVYTDEADLLSLQKRLQQTTGALQPLRVTPSRDIRRRSLLVFDRTFAITGVLRLLAMVIAFVGILSALMAMLLDRSREFAMLRANGMTPWQLGRLVSIHTGLLGFTAGLLSIPTGLMLAAVLVFAINRRVFGWTMQFHVDSGFLLQAIALGILAALLAGIYPAWRLAHTPPATALRGD